MPVVGLLIGVPAGADLLACVGGALASCGSVSVVITDWVRTSRENSTDQSAPDDFAESRPNSSITATNSSILSFKLSICTDYDRALTVGEFFTAHRRCNFQKRETKFIRRGLYIVQGTFVSWFLNRKDAKLEIGGYSLQSDTGENENDIA